MSVLEQIDRNRIPQHVAIIMDGNGRWAKAQGRERVFGHQNGVDSVDKVMEAAGEIGVKYMTLYAFSTENWNRPQAEVDALMEILAQTLSQFSPKLQKNNVRLLVIGDWERLTNNTKESLKNTLRETEHCTGLTMILALSYSSRWEITHAVKNIVKDALAGKITESDVDDTLFSNYLSTANIPDPDLLIRTSGELRISNFLMWQLSYSELYFTDICWPDFKKEEFYSAILDYQRRERRFGKTSEQIS